MLFTTIPVRLMPAVRITLNIQHKTTNPSEMLHHCPFHLITHTFIIAMTLHHLNLNQFKRNRKTCSVTTEQCSSAAHWLQPKM